jgi:hypothetical protein
MTTADVSPIWFAFSAAVEHELAGEGLGARSRDDTIGRDRVRWCPRALPRVRADQLIASADSPR